MPTTYRSGLTQLNTCDGEAVQNYLIAYLNAHPSASYHKFHEVLEAFPHQAHNFLILSLRWFYELAKENRAPIPMEDSVSLAKDVYTRFDMEPGMDFFHMIRPARKREFCDVGQHAEQEDIAMALVYYLSEWNGTYGIYDSFIKAMRREESTLQQSFTRLILGWCWYISDKAPADTKNRSIAVARGICACDRALPYI